ncbi:MAG: SH3 domain-containing protein [Chlorobium sp.]|nr:SH3 domain-containing protein [Chlorobium sp.]
MAEQIKKQDRLWSSVVTDHFADLTKASSLALSMAEQIKKQDRFLSSVVTDHLADLIKTSSLASTMAEQIKKQDRLWSSVVTDHLADFTNASSLASTMLEQFDKIGLSSADVMSRFEDSIQSMFPLTDINLNFVSPLPSVKIVVKNQAFVTTEADNSIEKIFQDRTQQVFLLLLIFFLKSIWDGIVMPQINDRLITPMVDSYQASQKPSSEKEQIIGIRNLTKGNKNVHFENSRFITGSRVNLRSGPSTKTEILAELNFGQVVTILQNIRDWVEISYIYENEILQGWVSKRYIGKFK